jgi:hypothetical protein
MDGVSLTGNAVWVLSSHAREKNLIGMYQDLGSRLLTNLSHLLKLELFLVSNISHHQLDQEQLRL